MQLSVEFRALEIMTGFRSSVLLLDARLELGGCILLADLASCLHFRDWLLLASLPVVTELIEMLRCGVGWGLTVGRSEEDGGGLAQPEEEDVLGSDGGINDTVEEEPRSGRMKGDTTDAGAASILAIGESSRGPT
jgi:hypothetical protein